MSQHIADFLNYLQFERKLKDRSLQAYRTDLGQFKQFLETARRDDETIDQTIVRCDAEMFRAFNQNLKQMQFSHITIARKFCALRGLYKFLMNRGVITTTQVPRCNQIS